jgi:hypothetical protein
MPLQTTHEWTTPPPPSLAPCSPQIALFPQKSGWVQTWFKSYPPMSWETQDFLEGTPASLSMQRYIKVLLLPCLKFYKGFLSFGFRSTNLLIVLSHIKTTCRVNWFITDILPMTKHLFISSSYVLHFEWIKMLWKHYFKF